MNKKTLIKTVFILCLMVMPLSTVADDFIRGDVDQDGKVSITDVTTLINYLLSQQWPQEEQTDPEVVTYVLNGIEINMVHVEGGTFTMGASGTDTEALDNEFPAHIVTLSDYWICTTEVTQQLWRAVMGSNPSNFTGDLLRPVEKVSTTMCKQFISKLNEMTGQNFRLPTEAEWEFAARGGNMSRGYKYAGSDDIDEVAWYSGNASSKTHPVAQKAPNELGLYDMSGNVFERCNDWYDNYNNTDSSINPQGPITGINGTTVRVHRGGSWSSSATNCRVTSRASAQQTVTYNYLGLRLAM